jgi:predicted glycosyltransferase
MKVLIYVQHLLGIGHFQRMAFIAEACLAAGMKVKLVSGGRAVDTLILATDVVSHLPSVHAQDERFEVYLKRNGDEVDQPYLDLRRDMLFDYCFDFNPDLIVIESYPFGRNYFKGEIMPLLEFAKAKDVPVISSVRDILVKKEDKKQVRAVKLLNDYFTAVLVHGDSNLAPLDLSFSAFDKVEIPVTYTGYISQTIKSGKGEFQKPTILVSAGGGAVGKDLIETVLKCAHKFEDYDFHIATGWNVEESAFESFKKKALDNVVLEKFNPHFRDQLPHAALSISQAGYNTTIEILVSKCRSIMVPFETETETEQFDRASILAKTGRITCIRQSELSDAKLEEAIRIELNRTDTPENNYNFGGIQKTLDFLNNYSARGHKDDVWHLVQDELAHWEGEEKQFHFWWRDDDVIESSKALDKMIALQRRFNQPLYLACIPELCGEDLAKALKGYEQIFILQHGYDHKNHGLRGEKKIELGGSWPIHEAQHDLLVGKQKLKEFFGNHFMPVLVPPWNRIDHTYFPFIEEHYKALSLFKNPTTDNKFQMINTQIDIIDWKKGKAFLGEEACLLLFLAELQKRRFGAVDITAPIGLLTHHLNHDDQCWAFLEKFLALLEENQSLVANSPNLLAA